MRLALEAEFKLGTTLVSWFWLSEWMKQCSSELSKLLPNFTCRYLSNNYTTLSHFKPELENGYNLDLDKLILLIDEIHNSSELYNEYSNIRRLVNDKLTSGKYEVHNAKIQECLSIKYFIFAENQYSNLISILRRLNRRYILRQYIEPIVSFIIFMLGFIWDGTLLCIFFKNKDLRTPANILVLNITINDLIGISVILPVQYFVYNFENDKKVFQFKVYLLLISQMIHSLVNSFSILALSFQRYVTISKSFTQLKFNQKMSRRTAIYFLVLIWCSAVFITFFLGYFFSKAKDSLIKTVEFYVIFTSVLLCAGFGTPIIVTVFNVKTVHLLRKSTLTIPGDGTLAKRKNARQKSSRIIICLTIAYWLTHFPFFVWIFFMPTHGDMVPKYVETVVYNLYLSNSFINPIAIYVGSKTIRNKFKSYLFRCWKNENV